MKYIELAFVVICVVAILHAFGRRLPVPMAVLQIAAGVALSAVATLDDLQEQTSLLFVMLVPPLLYIEAWQVPKRELLQSIKPVLGLAIGLVAVSTVVVGYGLHALLPEVPLAIAFALAAALASTDTVAVSNFAGRIPLPPRLRILLSGEGLLNDAVALVVFKVAVAAAVTSHFHAGDAAVSLLTVSAGGLVIGTGVALAAGALRRGLMSATPESVRIDTILSLLIPYAAFLAADQLGVSGVLATVAAGLWGGVLDRRHLRATTRLNGIALWGAVTLSLNGAVFVMLGLVMRQVLHRIDGYSRWHLLGYVALLTLALFALRLASTMLLAWWSRRHGSANSESLPSFTMQVVAVLCGVRGSLALSATLSIPLATAAGTAMPGRDLAVFLVAGTIGAMLLISGVVMPFLKVRPAADGTTSLTARGVHQAIARAALLAIDGDPLAAVSPKVREWAATWKRLYESRLAALESPGQATSAHRRDLTAQRELSMNVLLAQRRELARLQSVGALSHAVLQAVEIELDLAEIALDKLDWRGSEPA
ncbi:MAG: sodium:proton antiporter [Burkholderiales bacterium]|nr:sodium:proton antiporter [Burkholderiales bacterium]